MEYNARHHTSLLSTYAFLRFVLFSFLAVVAVWMAYPVQADTHTVTSLNDSGSGSLRQAVLSASSGDTIVFDPLTFSTPATITLTSGSIVINKSLTIDGMAMHNAMPAISGNHASRIFDITTSSIVTLQHLRVADGYCLSCDGAGIYVRAGSTLNLLYSEISGNGNIYGDTKGGGIFNQGILMVTHTLFSGNSMLFGAGLGIFNAYKLSVNESTFTDNAGTFSAGAGILNDVYGTASVSNSTLARNSADNGAAIFNDGVMMITNTTIVDNTASGFGGGLRNRNLLTMANSTIAGNRSTDRYGAGGGINNVGTAILYNTIIADNDPLVGRDCGTFNTDSITDGGHNLDSDNTCGFSAPGSMTSTNPLLGLLQINPPGQPLMTMALLPGSPAIDAGYDAACPPTDERGMPRPSGLHCDIGAFEVFNVNTRIYVPVIAR